MYAYLVSVGNPHIWNICLLNVIPFGASEEIFVPKPMRLQERSEKKIIWIYYAQELARTDKCWKKNMIIKMVNVRKPSAQCGLANLQIPSKCPKYIFQIHLEFPKKI